MIRSLINSSLPRLAQPYSPIGYNFVRTLYSAEALGIDKYLYAKEKINSQFLTSADKFRAKMKEYCSNSTNMIFTEDLKNMVYLMEKSNPGDVELVSNMMKKFNSQNKELRFGNFIFGPVIMRMFYFLGEEQPALNLFRDNEMAGFFDQIMSYHVLLDLLYEKGRFKDVRDVYDEIKSRQLQNGRYPKHCMVVVFGACYRENTPESYQYSTNLWKEMQEAGVVPMRKAATFAAALALNQNAPHVAIEIASGCGQQNYMTVRNLKALALAQMNRPEDTIPILRAILEVAPTGASAQQTVSKDVIEKVSESVAQSGNKELQADFARIEKFLKEHGHVSDSTLDEMLRKEVTQTHQIGIQRDRAMASASFSRNKFDDNKKRFRTNRPGLRDLY